MSAVPQFDSAFARVVGIEGSYSDDPRDSGGATMFGITERVARAHGYVGRMDQMPLAKAKEIYRASYWDVLHLDYISLHAPALAAELFDSSVNCGTMVAGMWLQRALNVLNDRGSLWADMPVDGQIGQVSLSALDAFFRKRGSIRGAIALRRLCDAQQGVYYLALAERREKDEAFVFGWTMNRLGDMA